jgi:multidrug transporter EmrE-like cation transporter
MRWILPLSFLILFEVIADIFAKEWSLHGNTIRWMGAIGSYVVANIFWLFALKNGSGLGRGAILFSVVSAILAVTIGFLFYKEQISKIQLLGVFLGVISVVLIFWDN